MLSAITNLFMTVVLLLVFAGTGYTFIKKIIKEPLSYLEIFIFSFALGYGIYGSIILVLGVLGFFNFTSFLVILSIGILLSLRYWRFLTKWVSKIKPFMSGLGGDAFSTVLIVFIFLLFIINTFISLAPITSADALIYHFGMPKQYLSVEFVFNYKGFIYAHTPQLAQMVNAFVMALRSDICAALLNSYFGMMMTALIFFGARRFFNSKIALIAAVLFYSMPLVIWEVTGSFVDIHLAFFCALSLYAMILYSKNFDGSMLLLSGLFMGIAISIKVFAIIYLLLLSMTMLFIVIRGKKSFLFFIRDYSIWFLAALVLGSGWYIFNYITTGNPFFPLFYDLLGGEHWNALTNEVHFSTLDKYGEGKSVLAFLMLPFNLLFKGDSFDHGEFIGPLMLVLPVFSFMRKKYLKEVLFLAVFILCFIILWFSKSQQVRFLLPVLPLVAALSALGFTYLTDIGKVMKIILRAILVFSIAGSIFISGYFARQFVGVIIGTESRDSFLTRMVWGYKCVKWINQNLDAGDKVLLRRYGSYYMDIPNVEGDYVTQGYIDYSKFAKPKDLEKKLKDMGVTHIYLYRDILPTNKKDLWEEFIEKQKLIYDEVDIASSSRAKNLGDLRNRCRVYELR